jgi:DNA-binding transcriptional LysR family regulator
MRRLPSFSALRAFEAAARLESFSLACRELHLTPSAISHQVLLKRSARSVRALTVEYERFRSKRV